MSSARGLSPHFAPFLTTVYPHLLLPLLRVDCEVRALLQFCRYAFFRFTVHHTPLPVRDGLLLPALPLPTRVLHRAGCGYHTRSCHHLTH